MAEVLIQDRSKGRASPRKNIHVDMTPMVDLGFLLITFFMLISNFSKPNVMDLGLPAKEPTPIGNVIDIKNQITFILGADNRVFYYQKEAQAVQSSDLQEVSAEGIEISKVINSYKQAAPKKDLFTIIVKPATEANYKNFVDMLDQIAITQNERYGITDLKDTEKTAYLEKLH